MSIINAYICILTDLLDMDNTTDRLAQDVNNCFAKYSSEYMIQENKKVIKKVKLKSKDLAGKRNCVTTFRALL